MNPGTNLRLVVSDEARDDLRDSAVYLAEQSDNLDVRFLSAAEETFAFLLENPGVGRQRDRTSTEAIVIQQWAVRGFPNHLIFYRVLDNDLKILRVLHGARNLPNLLD